jgi:HK97 family phage major capsid protein
VSDRLADQLVFKRDTKVGLIQQLQQVAVEERRDLSEQDMATITAANDEIKGLNRQLEVLLDNIDLAEDTQTRLRGLDAAMVPGDFQYRSAGQLLWDVLHQSDPEAKGRYNRVMRRAAEHMGTVAANTTPVAGDLGGLVVRPVVGPVSDPHPSGMPFTAAVGAREVTGSDGFGFSRPYIVDAGFVTGVGTQALEKAELASKAFTVQSTPVPLITKGGFLNISQQLLTFNPASLDIIVGQLRKRLESAIELAMVDEMNNSTGHVSLPADADPPAVRQAIFDAAAAYYGVTNEMPQWVAMGPLGWAYLGGLADLAGRPLFPTLGATNANGTASADSFAMSVAGLGTIVTPAITNTDLFVGGSAGFEAYLYRFPVLEAVEPSVLGRQVALAASIAGFRPTPFANATQRVGV